MEEYKKLVKLIDKNDVISFDIFDTLLLRNVQKPVDIFRLLDIYVKQNFNINDFFNMRITAEENSRTIENNKETNFDEIYKALQIDDLKIKEKIKNKELELENEFIIANPFMKKIYEYCKKKKKKILCITDMYLPLPFIRKLLENAGYNDIKVYLSCYYRKGKGTRELYQVVFEQEKYNKEKWLHIGDNYYSDYEQAKAFGINAYHYLKISERSDVVNNSPSIAASIVNAIRNNEANNGLDIPYWSRFGILNAAPIYYAFANWLYLQNKGHDNIYFLARDGYIIKKIFDLIVKKENIKIDSRYLYASRLAIQLPLLIFDNKKVAIENLTAINSKYSEKTKLKHVFEYFDIDYTKYNNLLGKYQFTSFDDEINEQNYFRYQQMVSEIYDDFNNAMVKNTELIKKYLEQENFDKYSKVYIVDVGWRGSIQHSLQKIIKNEIYGYYFCTTSNVYDNIFYNTQGFLLNYGFPKWLESDVLKNNPMYEFIFSAPEGSLEKFNIKNDKVIPKLNENVGFLEELSQLQEAALKVINKFLKYYEYTKNLTAEESVFPYRSFIEQKKFDDLLMFNKVITNVGYSGNFYPYVKSYSKEYIENNLEDFQKQINKSLWNSAYLIDGINIEDEYKAYVNKYINCVEEDDSDNIENLIQDTKSENLTNISNKKISFWQRLFNKK